MFHYLASIVYDGSDFAGWAKQPNQFTAQGYIEKTLTKIFQTKISILAASRTDKEVHALDQKFIFKLSFFLSLDQLKLILDKCLKKHIIVKNVQSVRADFHPIRNVVKKEYHYFINMGKYDLFNRKYRWEYNLHLNLNKLNAVLAIFQGQHDFFNFSFCRWKDKEKKSTVRFIDSLKVQETKKKTLIIKIISHGFLRYQIRAIVGEAINCLEGKQTIENLKEKLDNPQQLNKYKHLAPASGLYLWKITYKN